MTSARDERPNQTNRDDRSRSLAAGPLAVWMLIQLIVLSLSAAGVPLWYRAPEPVARVAAAQMLVAQLAASALLFPWLMRNVMSGACVILVSAPFLQLAALLAEVELARAAVAWSVAALWMNALLAWSVALRASGRAQLIGTAVAGSLTLGAPVLRYLRLEFSRPIRPIPETTPWLDPVAGALAQIQAGTLDAWPWLAPACLLLGGVLACAWSPRRAVAPSYPHH
jgi:hypothetical protein